MTDAEINREIKARELARVEKGRIRADFVSYIYDAIRAATTAFLAQEASAKSLDPEGKYLRLVDGFMAEYLASHLAGELPTIEASLDDLRKIMLEDPTASFELIGKVQLWACGLWGHVTALNVGHEAALTAAKTRINR